MTEIAIRNGHALAEAPPAASVAMRDDEPATDIMVWARQAQAAYGIAEKLAMTSFVPKAFQGKPDEITAAILTGYEMGMQPMAALRAMDIISNTPAFRALTLRALVISHGHEMWTEGDPTETRAVVCGRRKGSDKVERSVWTIERARKMGLAEKAEWRRQPGTMLHSRATSEVARRVAPDVILAMPYSAEELEDGWSDGESAPVKRTARRKTPTAIPASTPSLVAPAAVQPEQAAAEAVAAEAVAAAQVCTWCRESGHDEADCPNKELLDEAGDDFDDIEGAWEDS